MNMTTKNYTITRGYTLDLDLNVEPSSAYTMRVTTHNAVGEGTTNVLTLHVAHVDREGYVAAAETAKLPLGGHAYTIARHAATGPAAVVAGTITVTL